MYPPPAAFAEQSWLRLDPQHAIFFRRGEKPRKRRGGHERDVIDDDALTQIMAGAGLLGAPAAEGGLGDEQAMRILMLLARTGRRVSEICLLDRDPLLPTGPAAASSRDSAGLTARLRYQQTKIEGAPDTILVDEEIVAIIRAQQQWAAPVPHGQPVTGHLAEVPVPGRAEQPQRRPPLLGQPATHSAQAASPPAGRARFHRCGGRL